ncbi:apolipoprotein N-acyltransferase [Alphaproteobacteria bacterium KMM 3653]|uniref:Apolipoprotein N-acyltransferase n=2 Tax=Harenicola maris TaxID=2841044 RepID=A0AAP2G9K1_9RHOB|nr:apolipoprotein N-acyltransferase [Harenicola maris]
MAGWLGHPRRSFALFGGLGLCAATGQAPLGLAPVTLVSFAYALWLLQRSPLGGRALAWRGWALGTGYFAGALFWIVEPFLVDIARHGWMAPFALIGLAGGLALFWALAFGLAGRIGRGQFALWAAVFWTLAEVLRGLVFTGFPWAAPGHIWIGWPQMQLAALAGPDALTALTLFAAALPAVFRPRWLRGAALGVALVLAPLPYGLWRLGQEAEVRAEPVTIRLLQPNAPQHLKWAREMVPIWFQRNLDMSAALGAEGGRPDLIVWPETAVPALLNGGEETLGVMAQAAGGVPMVFGIQRWEGGFPRNSFASLTAEGDLGPIYDKSHLVPFGEYMPLSALFDRLGIGALAALAPGGYAPGAGLVPVDLGGKLGQVLPLICYEAIFPHDIRAATGPRAGWILQITNDAWFGAISGPYQHLAQARLRAVETGLPVLRSANTGVSAVIDARGQLQGQLALNTDGFLDADLPGMMAEPPFQRFGNWPLMLALGLVALGLWRRMALDPDTEAP